ncbi:Zinc finger, PMZ-type [Sesbania bispinosa]|nr:Zinc finger, PMZ-type [Sesbania bispinosa]
MDVQVINMGEGSDHRAMTNGGDAEPSEGEVNNAGNSGSHVEVGVPEPYLGMKFDSEDAAKTFCNDYARRAGFSSKAGSLGQLKSDGTNMYWEFVCRGEDLKRKLTESCNAMIRIEKKGQSKWFVTKFVKEHNHSMVSHSKVNKLQPRKHFSSVGRTMPDTYQGVGLVPSGVMYISLDGNHMPTENIHGIRNNPAATTAETSHPVNIHGIRNNPAAATAETSHLVKNPVSMNYTVSVKPPIQKRTLGRDARNLLDYFKKIQAENPGHEKLAHVCHMHPNFQIELYNCINLTETIEEFDSSWNSIISKYELGKNDWLQSLYSARAKWVPAYFRDSFFAVISPNHGFDGFFYDFVNQQTTLPMFFRQYEQALESWSQKEIEADFETICTSPVLKTPSPMEKQAADLYTRKIFLKFQEELVETFAYTANRFEEDGENSIFRVAKFEDDQKSYIVTLNHSELRANCSCQMFEYSGILCRHVLTVFTVTNVLTLPSHYILKRWTRNAKSGIGSDECAGESHGNESLTSRYANLCQEAIRCAEEGAIAVETYEVAVSALREARKKIAVMKRSVAKAVPPSNPVSGTAHDNKKSPTPTSDTTPLLWPRQDETRRFNLNDAGAPVQSVADLNLPRMAPVSLHQDDGPHENMVVLPRLKSMTWGMENTNSTPGNKVANINLKLQHSSRIPSTEFEVKFQVSRVTLEPILKSMTQISEQLSTAHKVAVISLKLQEIQTNSGESEIKFQVSRDTLGAVLRSMAYIREQLSCTGDVHSDPALKRHRK